MTRRLSQIAVTVVFVDEYDALAQEGPFLFQGDTDGSASEKAQDFISRLPGLPEPAAEPNRAQRRAITRKPRKKKV